MPGRLGRVAALALLLAASAPASAPALTITTSSGGSEDTQFTTQVHIAGNASGEQVTISGGSAVRIVHTLPASVSLGSRCERFDARTVDCVGFLDRLSGDLGGGDDFASVSARVLGGPIGLSLGDGDDRGGMLIDSFSSSGVSWSIDGGPGDDDLTVESSSVDAVRATGGDGNDRLRGTPHDVLDAGAGDDVVDVTEEDLGERTDGSAAGGPGRDLIEAGQSAVPLGLVLSGGDVSLGAGDGGTQFPASASGFESLRAGFGVVQARLEGDDGPNGLFACGGATLIGRGGDDDLRGNSDPSGDGCQSTSAPNSFAGGAGADRIEARNGIGESVDCGAGLDTQVRADATDTLVDCEVGGLDDPDNVCRPAPAGAGVVPVEDATLECAAKVTGACGVQGNEDVTLRETEFWTVSPNPELPRVSGQNLAPEEMPFPEQLAGPPASASPLLLGRLRVEPGGGCAVAAGDDAEAQGQAFVLTRPGPHLMLALETSLSYEYVAGSAALEVCPGSLEQTPRAGFEPDDPDLGDDMTWQPTFLCVTRTPVHFDVVNPPAVCSSLDGSGFPLAGGFINQYAAGARLGLPEAAPPQAGAGNGPRGGNACGPSSLLMGMREVKRANGQDLAPLVETDDRKPLVQAYADVMRDPPQDGVENVYVSGNAVAYLESLGWTGANTIELPTGQPAAREALIRQALASGPVVLSTAFGSSRWGRSGGGHMILVHRVSDDGRAFVVSDPAGDYFSRRTSHYGAARCGARVRYPIDWVVGFTSGRYLTKLGTPTEDPPVLLVRDQEPTATDADQDFWIQDAGGRRTGWIGGEPVEEIPGASAFADQPLISDPDSEAGNPQEGTALRTLVVPRPAADVQLRVRSGAGGYRLDGQRWDGGALVGQGGVSGGPGGEQAVAVPAIGISAPSPAAGGSTTPGGTTPGEPTTPGDSTAPGDSTTPGATAADPGRAPAEPSAGDPSPGLPAFGAASRVTLALGTSRISATGPLTVRVSNANAFAIRGQLAGETTKPVVVAGKRKRRVKLARKSFQIPASGRKTVRLKLPTSLRRHLQRTGRLPLRLIATVSDPAGNSRTVRRNVTLVLKRRR